MEFNERFVEINNGFQSKQKKIIKIELIIIPILLGALFQLYRFINRAHD